MNSPQIRLVMIVIYLGLLVLLGLLSNLKLRGNRSDYMLASQTIGPILLLLSIFGTTMTAFALVGSTGEAYKHGIGIYGLMASSSGIVHSLCMFVVGVRLWHYGKQFGHLTQVQFFRDRLDSSFVGLVLFPILVTLIIPYVLVGIMGGGAVIQAMTAGSFENTGWWENQNPALAGSVPPWLGSLVICAVVMIYVFFGGMRGTAWANAFQTVLFMVLGIVTFVTIAYKVGGEATFLESLQTATQRVDATRLSRAGMSKFEFLSYLFIPLSLAMFPHLFQHWLTARNAQAFKLTIVFHPFFILLVWAPCVFIGIWASTLNLPPEIASRENSILPYLVQANTGPVLAGLLTAGILAAIMSSLDSQFLCLGTMFTNDIVVHYAGAGKVSDRAQMWIARTFVVAIVGVCYALSLMGLRSVFDLGVWSFMGFAGLFPIVVAALYWRRLTAAGALAGILAMAGSWAFFFWQSGWGANKNFAIVIDLGEEHEKINPVVVILLCSTLAMIATSFLTRRPSRETLDRYFPTPDATGK